MKDDVTITPLHQPGTILDPLTEIAREGAWRMLADAGAALKAEAASFVAPFEDDRLPEGRQRIVHHGTGLERTIQTGHKPTQSATPSEWWGPCAGRDPARLLAGEARTWICWFRASETEQAKASAELLSVRLRTDAAPGDP